jgi:hypothetical protein
MLALQIRWRDWSRLCVVCLYHVLLLELGLGSEIPVGVEERSLRERGL